MKYIGFFLSILVLTFSCKKEESIYSIRIAEKPAIVGLASPIQLGPEKSYFLQSEYFVPEAADSLIAPDGLQLKINGDTVFLEGNTKESIASIMAFKDGFTYTIPIKKSRVIAYNYSFDPNGIMHDKVQLKGSFNAWNPESTSLNFDEKEWNTTIMLSPGEYEYLIVADGQEMLDPNNSIKKDNGMGGFNSIITIPKAKEEEIPFLKTNDFSNHKIKISSTIQECKLLVLWQNQKIASHAIQRKDSDIIIEIPKEALSMHRSYVRVWAYNDKGISNDLFIPLANGVAIQNSDQYDRMDKHAIMMYFLLIDRFNNGDSLNDFPVDDPDIHPKANHFGGDIQGVIDQLNAGYFDDLGTNTIWLSPITLNPEGAWGLYPTPRTKFSGYHGYWPIRSTVVDYRFGNLDLLKELTDLAHEKNMNILIDYVANHIHEEHPIYIEHPDWVTNLYLEDGSLNTERWDDQRLTTWFDTFLPTLDLSRPEVVEPMTDSAVYWLKEANIDGFRHDATKHIPEIFWETLTLKVKEEVVLPENREIFQIGETYGSKGLINSYIGTGKLDGQFDFNVYDDAVATFARKDVSFERLQKGLQESFAFYGHHNLMGYISGNQDRARFVSYASGDVSFEEDAKLAGWTRDIIISDSSAFERLDMLMAFITTIPGIPVIYYGDEIALPGANDPDNRRMMKFSGLNPKERELRNSISQLFHLRKAYPSLVYGDTEFLVTKEDQWAYSRTWFHETTVVLFNKGNQSKKITIPMNKAHGQKANPLINNALNIIQTDDQLIIELAPRSFEIVLLKS